MDSDKTTGQRVKLNLAGIVNDSIVDGPGIRVCIFAQGCSHNCAGCHNPETHSFGTGKDYRVEELVSLIKQNPLVKGVTFSGGDPLHPFNREEVFRLAKKIRKELPQKTIWLYTGYEWDEIKDIPEIAYMDVVCEGKFVEELLDNKKHWVGSTNQHVVDVKKSLAEGKIVEHES